MTRAAAPAAKLVGVLWAAGLACLAVITEWSPGATRMFAWPWTLASGGALAAPVLILVLRCFDRESPLVLPSRPWMLLTLTAATVLLLSALTSPYRPQSLRWSTPLLAGIAFFLAAFDWVHATAGTAMRRVNMQVGLAGFLTLTALLSLGLWISRREGFVLDAALAGRNAYPLGHANYTAGLALLLFPIAAVLAYALRGWKRGAAAGSALLALLLLGSSGSRAGLLALAALAVVGLFLLRLPVRQKILAGLALGGVAFALAVLNPRTRAILAPEKPGAAPNISNVQRRAMLTAGWRMGWDRPALGWGPGTTPLVFPRYRSGLDGGVENALQLHSAPAQIWAEYGGAGIGLALWLIVLAAGHVRAQPAAVIALIGYAIFSVFDWQLEVPVFTFAAALLVALLPAPAAAGRVPIAPSPAPRATPLRRASPPGLAAQPGARRPAPCGAARPALAGFCVVAVALVVLLGRPDPTPEMNLRALASEPGPAADARAVPLLRASLALNPNQEIAHFNLGWLIVVTDPSAAEKHFRAAVQLVPDKGGVYFGLGLARLNQGQPAAAARAFALECLNDPAFMSSPWWRDPAIAATRVATSAAFALALERLRVQLPAGSWAAVQLPRVEEQGLHLGVVPDGPERTYRRERTGYPVLMRNLDLPPPVDRFVVRESLALAPGLPPKGWLPSPLLLALLDAADLPKT